MHADDFIHYLKMKVNRTFKEKVIGHCNLFVVSLNTHLDYCPANTFQHQMISILTINFT